MRTLRGCFRTVTAEWSTCDSDMWPREPKIFPVWVFAEEKLSILALKDGISKKNIFFQTKFLKSIKFILKKIIDEAYDGFTLYIFFFNLFFLFF